MKRSEAHHRRFSLVRYAPYEDYSVTFRGRVNTESVGLIAVFLAAAGALVLFLMFTHLVNYLAKAIGSLRSGSAAGQETGRYLG